MAHHASFWVAAIVIPWALIIAAAVVGNHRGRQAQPPVPVKPADRTARGTR